VGSDVSAVLVAEVLDSPTWNSSLPGAFFISHIEILRLIAKLRLDKIFLP
jgi:hypothetical protein